jgi:hypothetical protein
MTKVDPQGITDQDREEFVGYLKICTDNQVIGVMQKERAAGRTAYELLAEIVARSRKLEWL